MSCARFPPDEALCIQAKEFNFSLIRSQNALLHALRVLHTCVFANANPRRAVICCFSGVASVWPEPIKPIFVKCCRDFCPSGRFSHLSQGTLQSGHWVLGHLPDQGHSCPVAQFGRTASSRKSLGSSIFFPFPNDGAHCALGNF